jgi:3',5'-cyclic-nucleotide phosphodiesterase
MEQAVGMETTLFGGPPELGNMLKLANGQIGFMTIFAHPLFANVADIIPAMGFAAAEILTNKGVWFTRAEHEKLKEVVKKGTGSGDGGAVSPRSQSPVGRKHDNGEKRTSYFPSSPLRQQAESTDSSPSRGDLERRSGNTTPRSSMQAVAGMPLPGIGQGRENGRHSRGLSRDMPTSVPNGHREEPQSEPVSGDSSHSNLADESRDTGVSMRAGSMAIPVPESQKEAGTGGPTALSSFTFATSEQGEPVRKYDPEQHYPPVHNSARASAPAGEAERRKTEVAVGAVQGDKNSNNLSPMASQGTEEALSTSETTDEYPRQPAQRQKDFEARRNRAASAPVASNAQGRQSFSVSSTSGSRGSESTEKEKAMARIMGNGDLGMGSNSEFSVGSGSMEGSKRRKESTRTLGRKRSRIKMGMMFWKKNKSREEVVDRPDEGVSGMETRSEGGEKAEVCG